ncbi:MAG: FAD-dependent oxidoreductase [Desulfobacteraceae bacterium]|jgi:NADPH-dependent glutamate synthase beta subunit-like oxidoreductase
MSNSQCPVNRSLTEIRNTVEDNRLPHPRTRRVAEELQTLVEDIAMGRGSRAHLPAMVKRIQFLQKDKDVPFGVELADWLAEHISSHEEVFISHIETHNCAAGDCDYLTPAPCQMACPAGIDVPTYVSLIGMGKDAEAIEVIRRDNPLPWVCGLVCTRPCEFMCVRGRIDAPVSIKFMKAFSAERALSWGQYQNPIQAPPNHRKVCVIGAGPGGLSAAYYLALRGYTVRVIEALPSAGGMIFVGIPRYRLPREVIDRETAKIEELGVEFCFNTRFGKDVTLEQLKAEGFEAFFLAIGAHAAFKLGIPGEDDYAQVHEAIDFLQRVALGERHIPGSHVVVIGGGNVAIDAARTCLRLGCEEVTLAYRRTRNEMPADEEEVEQAEEEGVRFAMLTVPTAVEGDGDTMTGLRCLQAKLVAKSGSKRMSPKPIDGSDFIIPADALISAIGQRVDNRWMNELKTLQWSRRDTIRVHTATMATDVDGVFAAGDAVTGPATVIEAIGGGKRAALGIDRYFRGIPQPDLPPVPVRRQRVAWTEVPAATKMVLKRPEMPLLNMDRRRTTFQQVELGYTENMVREEARRCLRCDICRRCGLCVQICRDKMGIEALELGYLEFDHPGSTDFRRTQQRCIACGACATNCPTGAMRMEDRGNERILSLCGTILNRQPLLYCDDCGAVLGTQRYLAYIQKRLHKTVPSPSQHRLCEACGRKSGIKPSHGAMPLT